MFDEDGQAGSLIEVSFEELTALVMSGSYMDRPIRELPDLVRNEVIGRGLARVVAHEIGHWVMGRGHTEDGLMKASFGVRDVIEWHTARLPRAWTAAGSELRLLLSSACELVASHRGARSAASARDTAPAAIHGDQPAIRSSTSTRQAMVCFRQRRAKPWRVASSAIADA